MKDLEKNIKIFIEIIILWKKESMLMNKYQYFFFIFGKVIYHIHSCPKIGLKSYLYSSPTKIKISSYQVPISFLNFDWSKSFEPRFRDRASKQESSKFLWLIWWATLVRWKEEGAPCFLVTRALPQRTFSQSLTLPASIYLWQPSQDARWFFDMCFHT